jgi:hypothetical protein
VAWGVEKRDVPDVAGVVVFAPSPPNPPRAPKLPRLGGCDVDVPNPPKRDFGAVPEVAGALEAGWPIEPILAKMEDMLWVGEAEVGGVVCAGNGWMHFRSRTSCCCWRLFSFRAS